MNADTGDVVQQIDYDAFGVVTQDTNPGFQPFGFAGGLTDPDTGLVRFGARDYDPRVGRWTSKDPIKFAGRSANLFAYAFAEPVNLLDPNGLAIVHNRTGRPIMVSGNPGGNHGTGDQAFGTVPPGATGGGTSNPVMGYPTRGEAEYAADPANFGPHRPVGPIEDVDYYDSPGDTPHSPTQCDNKVLGDSLGPEIDLTSDPSTGAILEDYYNFQLPPAFYRRIREQLFGE